MHYLCTVAHVQQLLLSPRHTCTAVRKMVPVSVRVCLVKVTVRCDGLRRVTSSAGITQGAPGGTLSVRFTVRVLLLITR